MTFELSKINHKSLDVDLDQELGFITSVVRCWITIGRDYAHDQVEDSLKRILNWLEQVPNASRPKIAKGMMCLVKVLNSILICLEQGAQESILSALGGLFITHMHFILDMTRPFCSKRLMDSQVTLLSEKSKIELPSTYKDLNEQMSKIISRSGSCKIDFNSDILEDVEFKIILEPTLTHSKSLMQKKWAKAAMLLEDKKLTLSVEQVCFFNVFKKV